MDSIKLGHVLNLIRPGANWTLRDLELEWNDTIQLKPTDDEIAAGETAIDALSYRGKRAAEYPLIADQLDAIMKGGQPLADMQAACMAVKAKYPKP